MAEAGAGALLTLLEPTLIDSETIVRILDDLVSETIRHPNLGPRMIGLQ